MTPDLNLDDLPDEVLREITRRAIAEGLLPIPDGYTPDNKPLWNLDKIAVWFGHTPEEAKELLSQFQDARGRFPTIDPATIMRVN